MKKSVMIGLIVGVVLILLVVGFFIFSNNNNGVGNTDTSNKQNEDNKMMDCGVMKNPSCFSNRMNECLPVTAKLTGTDGSDIEITILGIENDTCHFQRKVNGVLSLNCYFPKGTMNWDTIDQTFGNDKGLQKVVDDSCKTGW